MMEIPVIKEIILWILVVIDFVIVFWFYTVANQDLQKHKKKMQEIEDDYRESYRKLKVAEYEASKEYIDTLKQFVEDCKQYRENYDVESRRTTTADVQGGDVEN